MVLVSSFLVIAGLLGSRWAILRRGGADDSGNHGFFGCPENHGRTLFRRVKSLADVCPTEAQVATAMSITAVESLIDAIRKHRLLDSNQLEELKKRSFPDPKTLAKDLIQ